jgi:hypothetical protein
VFPVLTANRTISDATISHTDQRQRSLCKSPTLLLVLPAFSLLENKNKTHTNDEWLKKFYFCLEGDRLLKHLEQSKQQS